ncbi:MAG: hypothetical protein ABIR24_11295 [Verrucomicrobiota bacterium]
MRRKAICVVNDPSGNRRHHGCPKISKHNWLAERGRILLRLCRCLESRIQRGQSLRIAARKLIRKWNGRAYRVEPKRRIRLSALSLVAHYKKWLRDSTAQAFELNYRGPTARKVPALFILEAARRAQSSGVYSIQSLLRSIHADLKAGKQIPGIGKFSRENCPATLPFARTVYRFFYGIDLSQRRFFAQKIAEAQAELAWIDRAIAQRAKKDAT